MQIVWFGNGCNYTIPKKEKWVGVFKKIFGRR